MNSIIFGPVPSRRLGKSLGVNNIPPKICSYSCRYCQVGSTSRTEIRRQPFYPPEEIALLVRKKLLSLAKTDFPDYISIIPDGEPTLDANLDTLIEKLGSFGLPVAVFTNSSLISLSGVRDALKKADFVSLKIDTLNIPTWKKLNRPNETLDLKLILNGIGEFTVSFQGICVTETMMIRNLNDNFEEISTTANFLQTIGPEKAYIAIPTRPPAFKGTKTPAEPTVMMAYEIFKRHHLNAELLTGYEGNAFASSGNFQDDILSITAVHPMRREAVVELMKKSGGSDAILDTLIDKGFLMKIHYNHNDHYVRKFGLTTIHEY